MLFRQSHVPLAICITGAILSGCASPLSNSKRADFVVTADIREFSDGQYSGNDYFAGACQAIAKAGKGQFMISPGDIDPPEGIRATLDRQLGKDYLWYPLVGNHEAETPKDMAWLRSWGCKDIPGLVRRGPSGSETTTFSFDSGDAHFVMLNQYYTGKNDFKGQGDVVPELYEWLKADLEANRKPMVIVVGHEPIVPTPDMDNGRLRHETDSLNVYPQNAKAFKDLMVDHGVTVYLCAHTHNLSVTNIGNLWQVDAGHARGKGDPGAPSTFLKMRADANACTLKVYRQAGTGEDYKLTGSWRLKKGGTSR